MLEDYEGKPSRYINQYRMRVISLNTMKYMLWWRSVQFWTCPMCDEDDPQVNNILSNLHKEHMCSVSSRDIQGLTC
uniref:Uncharacterized protein n=1 Tax=Arion vulgaris TaxID=1028688 RepID=A0A0B7AMK4_9EUPU